MSRNRLSDSEQISQFVKGGNAFFTIVNPESKGRFTYRVSRTEDKDGKMSPWFVSVLTGPDNWTNYRYVGHMFANGEYIHGRKSKISPDAPSAKAIKWFLNSITSQKQLDRIEFWHEGKCGVCGRKLTVPKSIENGIGPVCEGKI